MSKRTSSKAMLLDKCWFEIHNLVVVWRLPDFMRAFIDLGDLTKSLEKLRDFGEAV